MDEMRKAKTMFKKLNPFKSESRFKGEAHTLGSSSASDSASSTPRNPRQDQQQQQQQQKQQEVWRRQQQERWEQEKLAKLSKKGHKPGNFSSDRQPDQSRLSPSLSSPQQPDRSHKPGTPSLGSSTSSLTSSNLTRPEAPKSTTTGLSEAPKYTNTLPSRTTIPYSSPAAPFPEDEAQVDREEVETQVVTFLSNGASKEALEVLLRLFKNIVREPTNEKFGRIRMSNQKIKETIGSAVGSSELLEFLGFQLRVDEQGETWYLLEVVSSERLAVLKVAASLLEDQLAQQNGVSSSAGRESSSQNTTTSAVAAPVSVAPPDRELRVFFCSPDTAAVRAQLPDDFYELSLQDVKAQAALQRKKIEESQLLMTKASREKQALARKPKFKFGIVRVQFPDGIVLQGVFLPREPTSSIYTFVRSALKNQSPQFELIDPANTKCKAISCDPDSSKCPTLEQAELLPTAVLKFQTNSSDFCGLHDEHLAKMEPLTVSPF